MNIKRKCYYLLGIHIVKKRCSNFVIFLFLMYILYTVDRYTYLLTKLQHLTSVGHIGGAHYVPLRHRYAIIIFRYTTNYNTQLTHK